MWQLPYQTSSKAKKLKGMDANFDEKQRVVLVNFQLPLKILTLAVAMIATEFLFLSGIIQCPSARIFFNSTSGNLTAYTCSVYLLESLCYKGYVHFTHVDSKDLLKTFLSLVLHPDTNKYK